MRNRVKIGTCSGPAEAAFVRSVFDAHELPVVINGEMHASVLGGLGGFIPLDILVDREDAEAAVALLRDVRAGEHAVSEDGALPDVARGDEPLADPGRDERADADGLWEAEAVAGAAETPPVAPAPAMTTGFDTRRRRTGAVLLLSVIPGFGAAHMSTGAWGRGIAIAAVNVVAIGYLLSNDRLLGGWLLFGVRFADMFGALWRVWSSPGGDRKAA
jgi:Putative prokaryotic signal transducing protein